MESEDGAVKITQKMAQAAMNAGEMPDISNAYAAIEAALEEVEVTPEMCKTFRAASGDPTFPGNVKLGLEAVLRDEC
jgi:hypothetical protein